MRTTDTTAGDEIVTDKSLLATMPYASGRPTPIERWTPTPAPFDLIGGALARAQGLMSRAKKGAENPFYHSKYADLASVWRACREALVASDIATVQGLHDTGDARVVLMETVLIHKGQSLRSMQRMEHKGGPQEMGKAITYLSRYMIVAFLGIPQEDDDGQSSQEAHNAASKPAKKPRNTRKQREKYTDGVNEEAKAQIAQMGEPKLTEAEEAAKLERDNLATLVKAKVEANPDMTKDGAWKTITSALPIPVKMADMGIAHLLLLEKSIDSGEWKGFL